MTKYVLYKVAGGGLAEYVGESDDPQVIVRLARGEYHMGFYLGGTGAEHMVSCRNVEGVRRALGLTTY